MGLGKELDLVALINPFQLEVLHYSINAKLLFYRGLLLCVEAALH